MTDNIKPGHYRKGEIDLYEAFSQIFPHNEYRAGMQMIAMRYMFRDKVDRVEDLKKAVYSLERLKEKEIEYREKQVKSKDEVIDDAVAFANHFRKENGNKIVATPWSDSEEDILHTEKEKNHKTPEEALGDMFEAFANMGKDFSETFHKYEDQEPTNIMKPKTAGQYLDEIYYEHEYLLKRLWKADYRYLARDRNGFLYAYDDSPVKSENEGYWDLYLYLDCVRIHNDDFPEVQWSDKEPIKIADLLETYQNGGESGK